MPILDQLTARQLDAHGLRSLLGELHVENLSSLRTGAVLLCNRKPGGVFAVPRGTVRQTDPKALENARTDLKTAGGNVSYLADPYEASSGCCAIAVMTEWAFYRTLDYQEIYRKMDKPAFVFDGRNVLDHEALHKIGFNVFPVGKAPLTHF